MVIEAKKGPKQLKSSQKGKKRQKGQKEPQKPDWKNKTQIILPPLPSTASSIVIEAKKGPITAPILP